MATSETKSSARPTKEEILQYLNSLWTVRDLMRVFHRSDLTIQYWHQREGMPVIRIRGDKRPIVRFDRKEVLAWAKRNRKEIFKDPPPTEAG